MTAEPDIYDEVERLTFAEYESSISDQFVDQFQYVYENSPFYREKFDAAGVDVDEITGIGDITRLPLTAKDELRQSQEAAPPFGRHRACDRDDIARVYTSSGTTGRPTFIGLTDHDLGTWTRVGARTAYAAGIRADDTVVGATPGGPFVAAVAYDANERLGATIAPVGPGNTDRIVRMFENGCGSVLLATPSYAEYFHEQVLDRGLDPASLGVEHIVVGGEPGAAAESFRNPIETAFDCTLTELMGNGDMSISMWGECEHQSGMHFNAQGVVYPELIDHETEESIPWEAGAEGELVYTALDRECLPLVRFRTNDHAVVTETNCECGRGMPAIRCVGRTDDMIIVRGVNVFPTSVKDVVSEVDGTTGHIRILLDDEGPSVPAPVDVQVEVTQDADRNDLAERIEERLRDQLQFRADVDLVASGSFERFEYKGNLVEIRTDE